MKMKKATAVALAAAVAVGTLGFAVPAKASELIKTTDYIITIPATLDVEDKGWNGTAGITAKLGAGDVFDSEKKLTVTAESENGWKLEAEGVTDTVGYNLAASGDTDSVYSADAPAASWNFTAGEITPEGTKKDMGIVVEDYTTKAAGNYTDTVTFTAKVEDAAPVLTYIEVAKEYNNSEYMDNVRFYYIPGETYRQAVQNHGKENGTNWNIFSGTNNTTIYWGYGQGNLLINGKNNFDTGSSYYCGFTLDSVVDPNQTYTHAIMNR